MNRRFLYGALCTTIIVLDRVTKYWALYVLEGEHTVNNFLSYMCVLNRGVTWGMLHAQHEWLFVGVTILVMMMTGVLVRYTYARAQKGHVIIGELMVLAGSLSNIADRILYKGVVDFIVVSYGKYSWPIFNIADAAIVIGVGVMLISRWYDNDTT